MHPDLDYYSPDDLDVHIADMLVATPDGADNAVHPKVQEVLGLLRDKLGMDVVFVSQFVDDRRVFRFVDRAAGAPTLEPGQSDPLEESWCQRVVDGRLPGFIKDAEPFQRQGAAPQAPFPIGTHISTPIRSPQGGTFGTLCCFSSQVKGDSSEMDLKRLQYSAKMLADHLDPLKTWPSLPNA